MQRRIGHFSNLPQLLAEAHELGTDVVYVWDYWERAGDDAEHYRNKGDYCPRRDMGGKPALRAGIQMVHRQGGKVIFYVEPFIVWRQSEVGRRKGALWTDLLNLPFYGPDNPTMIAPFRPWQDHIVDLCTRLVKQYGADGIYLDSWGWQWNWSMRNLEEGRTYTPQEFTRGVLELADRVRGAIGPNRVVVCESTSGQLGRSVHGGLSSGFGMLAGQRWRNQFRILASPVRYGLPHVNFISNGLDMNELHQIFAAGHPLALCWNWHPRAGYSGGPDVFMRRQPERDHIKQLLEVRRNLKNGLVYGRQTYQPDTGDDDVAAYYYEGTAQCVLTAVNTSTTRTYFAPLTPPTQ